MNPSFKYFSFFFLLILCTSLFSCKGDIVTSVYPQYEFNYGFYIRTDTGLSYFVFTGGDITNTGTIPLRVVPYLEVYFTLQAYDNDRPDLVSTGQIGHVDTFINIQDPQFVSIKSVILPNETLQHMAKTKVFIPPLGATGLYHRLKFIFIY